LAALLRAEVEPAAGEHTAGAILLCPPPDHPLHNDCSSRVPDPGASRRQLLRVMGIAASVADITTIAIPTAAQAACLVPLHVRPPPSTPAASPPVPHGRASALLRGRTEQQGQRIEEREP
jgi:hypothetical protein